MEKVQKVRAETSPKDESSKPKKTSEAEGEGDGEADAEEASQSGSEERTTIEQVRAKKAAHARYMRFSRSLKSKSRWDIHGLQLRSLRHAAMHPDSWSAVLPKHLGRIGS